MKDLQVSIEQVKADIDKVSTELASIKEKLPLGRPQSHEPNSVNTHSASATPEAREPARSNVDVPSLPKNPVNSTDEIVHLDESQASIDDFVPTTEEPHLTCQLPTSQLM